MIATSPVPPGPSTRTLQRIAIARALAASMAPDTLTTAKIAPLHGITEVHCHG